ncbi:unnamed protein product [Effrenium voratum]|nr:unnamed protein product [Effrenium voratum]
MASVWQRFILHIKQIRAKVNKYLLFLRIVLAEMFKDLRLNGWPMQEVKDRMEVIIRSAPQRTNSASSMGIVMQITRVLWEELIPQLEQTPRASQQVIMALVEPFVILSEGSYVMGLVRSIHEHVFKPAPWDLLRPLMGRLLEAAAKSSIIQANREALYEAVDWLEKRLQGPAPETALLDMEAPAASTPSQPKAKRKKRGVKRKDKFSQVSPMMLPQAAEPELPKLPKKRSDVGAGSEAKAPPKKKSKVAKKAEAQGNAATGNKLNAKPSKKRQVTFNLQDKVVKFSENLPVAKMKGSAQKRTRRRRDGQ